MTSGVEYYRLEAYSHHDSRGVINMIDMIVVSFQTRQHGIYQIKYDGNGVSQLPHEPDLYMFTMKEQEYIKEICAIVYRIVFDTPACKERFE